MWVTAFSFHHTEQEPGMEFIDMSVIDGGLTYILGKQSKTGEFPVTGPVHNYELLVNRSIIWCYMLSVGCNFVISVEREKQCSSHCLHCRGNERIRGHVW